jgi:hypothetical protein
MSLVNEINQEIRVLTQHLTEANICQENQFPALRTLNAGVSEVYPSESMDMSAAMRNVPYAEAYDAFRKAKAYNMILLDGAMIHFRYRVKGADVVKHNIGYWPSPRLLNVDQASWIYDEDEPFGDAVDDRGVLPVPIRIDFAPDQFVEHLHPKCHTTIGQYPNCRIAVAGPVRPGVFLDFVLRNFYRKELASLKHHFPFPIYDSVRSITDDESSSVLHFMIPRISP